MIKLQDWSNKNKVGTRFPESKTKCPQCGEFALKDTWPPDLGWGSGSYGGEESFYKDEGSQKYVCINCKHCFRISYRDEYKGMNRVKHEEKCSEFVPLVEKDGIWLTPHDVWREEYKAEHGKYPQEAYA